MAQTDGSLECDFLNATGAVCDCACLFALLRLCPWMCLFSAIVCVDVSVLPKSGCVRVRLCMPVSINV